MDTTRRITDELDKSEVSYTTSYVEGVGPSIRIWYGTKHWESPLPQDDKDIDEFVFLAKSVYKSFKREEDKKNK